MWIKHLLSSEQSVFDLQLQQNLIFFRYIMFLLCADNSILSHAHLFLWKILCRGYSFGKWLFTSFKNIFPTFVFTFKENGEFNHIIFFCFLLSFFLRFFFSEVLRSVVFCIINQSVIKTTFSKRLWVCWYWITKNAFIRWNIRYLFDYWFR